MARNPPPGSQEMTMSELAYDANGYPIRLKPEARKWLIRKHRPKAPPQVMFRNGQRSTLPINAGHQDLRHIINDAPGRYRLIALDEFDQPVDEMAEAYVEIDAEPPAAFVAPPPAPDPLNTTRTALASSPIELLLLETVRANTELARATIDRIPDILRSSAYLLQTADGAGLPRRPPMRIEEFDDEDDYEDDDDDDEPATPQSSLLDTFFRAALMNGGGLGGFAKLLGAGGAPSAANTSTAPETAVETAAPSASPAPTAPRNAAPAPPPVDTQAHLLLILAQLTPAERAYAERVFAQLSPEAVRQWHELLLSMSVDDAITMIRSKAAGQET